LMPMMTVFAIAPLALEWGLKYLLPMLQIVPIGLLLSIVWIAIAIIIYAWLLPYQGRLFARREKELLRVVTSKIE
jgi:beta-lactamase regulating signal transducer with metallopeptidase domain